MQHEHPGVAGRWRGGAVGASLLRLMLASTLLVVLAGVLTPHAVGSAAAAPVTTASVSGTNGRNGWYKSSGVYVALSARAAGTGVVQTYYRVLPTAAYTLYSGPFAVYGQGEHSVVYFSVQGPAAAAPRTTHFWIDSLPPVTVPAVKGALTPSGWYHGTVAITLLPSDATSGVAATYWDKDNKPFGTYHTPIGLSGSGLRKVAYYSVDRAGNIEEQHQLTLPIDNLAPVLAAPTLNGVPYARAAHTLVGPVTIALGASDAQSGVSSIAYRLNGGAWTPFGGPLTIEAPGAYHLAYVATDRAGNSSTTGALDVTVAAPAIGVVSTASGTVGGAGWYRSSVAVTLVTTPAGTMARYRLDGGAIQTYSAPIMVSGDGHHQVLYQAITGSTATQWQARDIAIDATPPGTTATIIGGTPHASGWYNSAVTVRLDSADALSGIAATYWQKDGQGPYSLYSGAIVLQAAGHRTITYYSLDRAGNPETPHVLAVPIDRQAPTTSATVTGGAIVAGAYSGSAVVTLRAVDDLSGVAVTYISVDGAAPSVYSSPIALATSGAHVVTFNSVDNAGNLEDVHRIAVPVIVVATPLPTATATFVPTQTPVATTMSTATTGPTAMSTATALPSATPVPPDTHRVNLKANHAVVGWGRMVTVSVHAGPGLAGTLVILRQHVHGRPWRNARAAILDGRGTASWTLLAREPAVYVAVVANLYTSAPLDVRVSSVVVLRHVHADLPGQAVFSGRAWPALPGHVVMLQVGGAHGTWHTVTVSLEQQNGLFAFIVLATRGHERRWRAYDAPARGLEGGRSNIVGA